MGLDITARIINIAEHKAEMEYKNLNLSKVETGEMTNDEYFAGYPFPKYRTIDVSEYGIRNFWGLRKFCLETLKLEGDSTFFLNKDHIEKIMEAAYDYEIPNIDTYNYYEKCDELSAVCLNALFETNWDEELVEFFFCS